MRGFFPYQITAKRILDDIFTKTDSDSKIPMNLVVRYVAGLEQLHHEMPGKGAQWAWQFRGVVYKMIQEVEDARNGVRPGMSSLETNIHKHNIELLSGKRVSQSEEELTHQMKAAKLSMESFVGFIKPTLAGRAAGMLERGGRAATPWLAQLEEQAVGLPEGWEELRDDGSGDVYYLNNETGETQWSRPQMGGYKKRRKSTRRKSTRRKSVRRKSAKRKSAKRKSTKRKSTRRKSTKRKSTKRRKNTRRRR